MGQSFRCNSKNKLNLKMKSAICLVLLLVATASAFQQCGKKGAGGRIINGVDAGHGNSRGKSPFASADTGTSAAELSSETNTSSALLIALDKPRTPDLTPSVLVNGTCNLKMEPKRTMPSLKSMSTRGTTAPSNSTMTSPS